MKMKTESLGQTILEFCEKEEGFCAQDVPKFFDALDCGESIQTESGREYRILHITECWEEVTEEIKEVVWIFRPHFLASLTGLPPAVFEILSELREGANDAILEIIRQTCGLETFVSSVVSADGFGRFLAIDGSELKIPGTGWILFRVN